MEHIVENNNHHQVGCHKKYLGLVKINQLKRNHILNNLDPVKDNILLEWETQYVQK